MEKSIEILKSLLIPELEKDAYFKNITINDFFWETFLQTFLNFENDAKFSYELIYGMRLNDAERIFIKFPFIYSNLIKKLAELCVLGFQDKSIDFLVHNNNFEFQKEVTFLYTLQNVIKKVERKRIKSELPNSYNRSTFELSENKIEAVAMKKGREDLKEKFKKWDLELHNEKLETVFYSLKPNKNANPKPKVISLSWIKYAVAACVVITSGVLYFKFSQPTIDNINQPQQNNVVIKEKSKAVPTDIIPDATYITTSSKLIIEYPSSLGFTGSTAKFITILFKDASASIKTIRSQIDEEISEKNNTGVGPRATALKEQLHSLESKQNTYEFDGKQLIVYSEKTKETLSILTIDDKVFYLKQGNQYSYLYFTKIPLLFQPVKEATLIEQLEKISFENE